MKAIVLLVVGAVSLSSGCSTMNESFTCDQTAGDSCLTIDAVNAMTEPKGAYTKRKIINTSTVTKVDSSDSKTLWVASFKDSQGHYHQEQTIALVENNKRGA